MHVKVALAGIEDAVVAAGCVPRIATAAGTDGVLVSRVRRTMLCLKGGKGLPPPFLNVDSLRKDLMAVLVVNNHGSQLCGWRCGCAVGWLQS